MDWIFNKMDYKWIGLKQKWNGSRKLDFLLTPNLRYNFFYMFIYFQILNIK